MNKKLLFIFVCANIVLALTLLVSSGKATEERTLWERVATLELENVALKQRVEALEKCNPTVCTASYSSAVSGFSVPSGSLEVVPPTLQPSVSPTEPNITTTPEPSITPEPSVTIEPSTTPEPSETPEPEEKERCNQGRGNGSEGCDPGKSNHRRPSNDEEEYNRGGNWVPNR